MADVLPDPLLTMLERLKLTALRDRIDNLLDEAGRREMTLRECLALLLESEIAHREERRMRMATGIAKFPFVRTLEGFDFAAQPSLDPGQVRDLAACRWVANGDALLVLGPPGVGKTQVSMACRVRCHGEDEGAHSFDEVIADRTRLPACREPGHSAGANRAESGFEDPERSVDRLVTVTSQSPTRPRRRGKSNMIAAPGPQDLVGRE